MPESAGRVLILGGTSEAGALASALDAAGVLAVSSLAGRLAEPRLPDGETRVGGFGGADRLARWLRANQVAAVIDATHPFATRISAGAAEACARTGVPLLRVERPGWTEQPGDCWHRVASLAEAAALTPTLGRRVLLTLGRQHVGLFASIGDCWFLVRCIEAPAPPLPPHHQLLLDRGPYTLDGELALLRHHRIDLLVTRDSGGAATEAKLTAARALKLPVLMVQRPPSPAISTVPDVERALAWLHQALSGA